MSTKTENRRPHTVYLRDEIWDALDRSYLETRLNSAASPSKIEFIEQVLEAGMETVAAQMSALSSAEDNRRKPTQTTAQRIPEKTTTDEGGVDAPPLSGSAQRDEQETAESTSPTAPPLRGQAARRSSALERLVRASEPGRPAPINSAATSENQETAEQQ